MNCHACDYANIDGARFCAKCGASIAQPAPASDDPMLGTLVGGRFRILRLLGEGGMGRVYVAEQQMGTAVRKVAVKTLLKEFSGDPQVQGRFHRECGTVVGLEHANTIKFYDFGTTETGDLYIAMEFVDGEPLADVIVRGGSMAPQRVDNIMKQICGSLQEAHDKGIIHRDLKPENIVLTERAGERDFVKVLDFGIAKRSDAADQAREQKLTQAGMVLGTPPYMSPEQFTGKELDRRSDIYSLGIIAYEMLTGTLPFKANTAWEWATQHMTVRPFAFEVTNGSVAAAIPEAMKTATLRALSKNAEERQSSAKELYQELSSGVSKSGSVSAHVAATEAFQIPPSAQGHAGGGGFAPNVGLPGGGMQPGGGMPHVPPAAPYQQPSSGGGGKLVMGLLGGLLLLGGLGAGGWYLFQHQADNTIPVAQPRPAASVEPVVTGKSSGAGDTATGSSTTSTGDAVGDPRASDTGAGNTTSGDTATGATGAITPPPPPSVTTPSNTGHGQPPPPPPPPPSSGCGDAIAAAMAGRCGQASAALARCSGSQKSVAEANVTRCVQKNRGRH